MSGYSAVSQAAFEAKYRQATRGVPVDTRFGPYGSGFGAYGGVRTPQSPPPGGNVSGVTIYAAPSQNLSAMDDRIDRLHRSRNLL